MKPMRLRINKDIVTEFLPPRHGTSDRAIVVCDGLPSVPSKRHVLEYWSKKGFWVFHPRYKGTWESSGRFLDHDPTDDIIEVARVIRAETVSNVYDHTEYTPHIQKVIVMGASFGGAVALLSSLYPEVDKAVAISPVVDWAAELKNTIEPLSGVKNEIRDGFGEAYRFSDHDFDRLGREVDFFNPIAHINKYNSKKLFILHAKDDMIVSLPAIEQFIETTGCEYVMKKRGGHLSSSISTTIFGGRGLRRFVTF